MTAPALGITIVIILVFAALTQLLVQAAGYRRRHEELKGILERIEELLKK